MRLTLRPIGEFGHGQVHSYAVELRYGDKALLTVAPGKGWDLKVVRDTMTINRGLFASPHDAIAVLEAEYYPLGQQIA